MCRYAFHTYKSHFACFACRKAFKKTPIEDYIKQNGLDTGYIGPDSSGRFPGKAEQAEKQAAAGMKRAEIRKRYLEDVSICPQCRGQMAAMGLDFKAPPQRDVEAWKIIATLYENGFAFQGCGCSGPGYAPPVSLRDLPQWLGQHQRKSEGAKLLDAINARASRQN